MTDVLDRLDNALTLTDLLAASLADDALSLHNADAPSNTIGAQFWCIVGARESYARGIVAWQWQGFSCSLSGANAHRSALLHAALDAARASVTEAVATPLSSDQTQLVFDLLEHEVQHHGQLIRYFYANALPFPDAFAKRYALQQPR